MQIKLDRVSSLRVEEESSLSSSPGTDMIRLDLLYCAICRTDAKCWDQGHRDLALPRVLGHEMVGVDPESGRRYTVWPGQACGSCSYCRGGRENLCEEMKIIGFHSDGGFASQAEVPKSSLIPLPEQLAPEYFCFCEPVACVINSFEAAGLQRGQKVIIYGGGVVGLLAGLIAKDRGALPTIIELHQEKIARAHDFTLKTGIPVRQDTQDGEFHIGLNACDSPMAFSQCLLKVRKRGSFAYFSGLKKNEEIDTNLLNLIHYKELQIVGSYGPLLRHMEKAVPFCSRMQDELSLLIEAIIPPSQVAVVMPDVLAGRSYKYILDCKGEHGIGNQKNPPKAPAREYSAKELPGALKDLVAAIEPVNTDIRPAAQAKIDYKTKPLGALGRIEELAVQLSCIQNDLMPAVPGKNLIVFAGDHGVVEEGVSAFPSKVTKEMVRNFLAGGAAINVFCRQYAINLAVADIGVKGVFKNHPMLYQRKVQYGTNNFSLEPAMSPENCVKAIVSGAEIFQDMHKQYPCQLVGLGEMGIGNTSSATAIISAATGLSIPVVCGRGTGVDDKGMERKIEVLEKALSLHHPDPENGFELLSCVGGYEIAAIVGATLAATGQGVCVVLDGVISTAAGLIAYMIAPEIQGYLVSGHKSVEIGQQAALEHMDLKPVHDLDMRLGEGSGAALTMNTIDLACAIMRDMASFDEAGVSTGA